MKKIILVIVMLLLMVGCAPKYEDYTELNYDQVIDKINNKETFAIVFGSDTCSACANYRVTMKEVIKEKNIEIFYLDINKLDDQTYAKMYSKFVITSTPTTVFIKNGVETSSHDRIIGAAKYSHIINDLKKHGFIGE